MARSGIAAPGHRYFKNGLSTGLRWMSTRSNVTLHRANAQIAISTNTVVGRPGTITPSIPKATDSTPITAKIARDAKVRSDGVRVGVVWEAPSWTPARSDAMHFGAICPAECP